MRFVYWLLFTVPTENSKAVDKAWTVPSNFLYSCCNRIPSMMRWADRSDLQDRPFCHSETLHSFLTRCTTPPPRNSTKRPWTSMGEIGTAHKNRVTLYTSHGTKFPLHINLPPEQPLTACLLCHLFHVPLVKVLPPIRITWGWEGVNVPSNIFST